MTSGAPTLAERISGAIRSTKPENLASVAIALLTLALFSVGFRSYFAIDDFASLYDAKYKLIDPGSLLHVFVSNTGPFYRPLSQNFYFWATWHVFGMKPVGYLGLSILGIVISALYLFRTFSKLTSWGPAFAATILAGASSSRFELATWASPFCEVAASTAFIIAIFHFVRGSSKLSSIWFLLALLCDETATPLPLVALAIALLIHGNSIRQSLRRTAPLWGLLAAYTIFRLFVTGLVAEHSGPFALTTKLPVYAQIILTSFENALGWFPELNNVFHSGGFYGPFSQLVWIAYICILVAVTLIAVVGPRRNDAFRFIAAGLIWFVAALAPLLLFSANNWTYYNLAIPIFGIGLMVSGIFQASSEAGAFMAAFKHQRLAIVAAALQLAINTLAIYGPGGWRDVDGITRIEDQTRAFHAAVKRELVKVGPRNFHLNIVTPDIGWAAIITEHDLALALLTDNGNFHILYSAKPSADPAYTQFYFDPQNAAYTLMNHGRLPVLAAESAILPATNSVMSTRLLSVVKDAHPPKAVVRVTWKAPKSETVEIHVNAPDGPLLAAWAGNGVATTGEWVTPSTRFYLQDVTDGNPRTMSVVGVPKF